MGKMIVGQEGGDWEVDGWILGRISQCNENNCGGMIRTREGLTGKFFEAEISPRVEGEIEKEFGKGAYSVVLGDGWRDLAK
jgi:hypothetical protein